MKFDFTPEGLAKGNFLKLKAGKKEINNARALIADGRLMEALQPMVLGLIAKPDDPSAYENFANYFEASGQPRGAIAVADASVHAHPDKPGPLLFLAEKLMRDQQGEAAANCCKKAVELQPANGPAWQTLSDIYWKLGRKEEAFECCEKLLHCKGTLEKLIFLTCRRFEGQIEPSVLRRFLKNAVDYFPASPVMKTLLAGACVADGRPGEAIEIAKMVENYASNPLTVCVLVRAHVDTGRPDLGLKLLSGDIDVGDQYANIEALKAVCLRLTGQILLAKNSYENVLKAGVQKASLFTGYAMCLRVLDLKNECLAALDKGLELTGDESGLLVEKAQVLSDLSRHEEAEECLRSSAFSWQNATTALEGPSLSNAEFEAEVNWQHVEGVFNQGTLTRNERLNVMFAIGHQREAAGDYRQAMSLWYYANEEIRASYQFDVGPFLSWLRSIPAELQGDISNTLEGCDPGPFRPIFVFGMPRSGTSLVEHILGAHSDVKPGGESTYVTRLIEEVMLCFPGEEYPTFFREFDEPDFLALRDKFFSYWKFANLTEKFVVDKLPGNFVHVGLLQKIFPEAVFVECVRERHDTALSIFGHWFREGHPYAYNFEEILAVHDEYDNMMRTWRNLLGEKRIHRIQYEELVKIPKRTIQNLLGSCELVSEEGCFSPHKQKRAIDNANARRLEMPIVDTRVGRSRNYDFAFSY